MLLRTQQQTTRAAFTLMEIIAVVTIILILAGAGVFVVTGVIDNARRDRARMDCKSIEKALFTWKTRYGDYPSDLSPLFQPIDNSPALLDPTAQFDPWGRTYHLDLNQRHPTTFVPRVFSEGDGTSGIIDNWGLEKLQGK